MSGVALVVSAGVAAAAMVLGGVASVRSGRRRWPLLLLPGSLVWPLVNGLLEGPVLWVPIPGHGLTVSDLLTPIGVLAAVSRLRRISRHRRAEQLSAEPATADTPAPAVPSDHRNAAPGIRP